MARTILCLDPRPDRLVTGGVPVLGPWAPTFVHPSVTHLSRNRPSFLVDPRPSKKVREAERLRDVSPEETLLMGFQLIRFAHDLAEAADRA
jgi:hypothetical protein